MRMGALLGPVSNSAPPGFLADQARTYVAEGFESLWAAQAVGRGFMITDPLVALGVAAAVTEEVELGTAVVQLPLYAPGDLAQRVFSLMQVAGSRLILGVGAGSTAADFEVFGRSYESRFADFSRGVAALRELFATGKGDGFDLCPWPSVLGGPPLFLGSWGAAVERAARTFDGWIASGAYRSPDEVIEALGRYRRAGGGRAIVSTIQMGPATDLGEMKETLARYAEAGFDDAVVMLMPGGATAAEARGLV